MEGELLEHALGAALATEHESYRAAALVALAPQLDGELLKRALDAALAIGYEGGRAEALGALTPHLEERGRLRVLLENLLLREGETRPGVLQALEIEAFWEPEAVPGELVAAVARHVQEICWEWRWQ
jgi:hypothetical protein